MNKKPSMAERQRQMMQRISQEAAPSPASSAPFDRKPVTAVGPHFLAVNEVQKLRVQLEELEKDRGAAVLIDSDKIHPTRWANRHPAAFENEDFAELCQQVEHTKGNVQPILVQPIEGRLGEYEIIYGHRRHRANLKGGFKTRCNILSQRLSDAELFGLMDAENRGRANPSLYEQGLSYAKALDEGLYPSQNALSKALGVSPGWASRAIGLVRLPTEILEAFANPMEITSRQALVIRELFDRDPDLLKSRALKIHGEKLSADKVLKFLQGGDLTSAQSNATPSVSLESGKKLGVIKTEASGSKVLRFSPNMLTDEQALEVLLFAKKLVESAPKAN